MSIYSTLQGTNLPCAYSHFKTKQKPPYLVYLGSGQNNMKADDTFYHQKQNYQVEYYFTEKNEQLESDIEDALLNGGYLYEKSEDIYIEDQNVFVIYYYV